MCAPWRPFKGQAAKMYHHLLAGTLPVTGSNKDPELVATFPFAMFSPRMCSIKGWGWGVSGLKAPSHLKRGQNSLIALLQA